ncbi:MAG: EAL domain-containing protein [Woeseiaceae bacterium]
MEQEDNIKQLADDLTRIARDADVGSPANTDIAGPTGTRRRNRLLKLLDAVWPNAAIESSRQLDGLRALTKTMDSSERGYWIWDLRSNNLEVSNRWSRMMGLASPSSSAGLSGLLPALSPAAMDSLADTIDSHLKGFTAKVETEFRITDSAGNKRWVECHAVVERDALNNALVLAGTMQDITVARNTHSESGFLNETGLAEAIDDSVANHGRPVLIVVDSRCNRCRIEDLEPGLRRRFRTELIGRITDVIPDTAILAELRHGYFGILIANAKTPERMASDAASGILRSIRGVGKPLVTDFLVDADVGASMSDELLSPNGAAMIRSAIDSIGGEMTQLTRRASALHSEIESRAGTTSSTVSMIRRALSEDTIVPFFQPIVTLHDGNLVGYEALVRLEHPQRGFITPAEFLPTAELSDQIVEIGDVILKKSLSMVSAFRIENRLNDWPEISINISGRQLCDERLPRVIDHALSRSGVPASRLRIELTETTLIPNLAFASRTLNRMRATGIQIALDDFGAGFSSLTYLHELPIDVIKIDRRFVRHAEKHVARSGILTAIADLAKTLGVPIIAEGVESHEEARLLHGLNIRYAQGYLIGKPKPTLDFEWQWRGALSQPGDHS